MASTARRSATPSTLLATTCGQAVSWLIFPEGTSEWGFQPLPYRPGAARIVCRLMEEGLEPEVIPMGLFYSRPDRFRSRAELFRGTPVQLPPRGAGDRAEWEAAVNQALAGALDEVSVNCPDQATFDLVQGRAAARARRGESFSKAFLELQAAVAAGGPVPDTSSPARVGPRVLGLALMWIFAPILLVAGLAGSKADARNTVTFFRQLGGLAASLLWLPALAIAALWWPEWVGAGVLSGVLGFLLFGVQRWRP